jgi:hypothetical protein
VLRDVTGSYAGVFISLLIIMCCALLLGFLLAPPASMQTATT